MKTLNKLLSSGRALASIEEKLAEQEALLKQLRSLLPQPISEHCIWAIPKKGDLILLVDSPVWASRLRYLSPKLNQQLRQYGLKVRRIQVKVSIMRGDVLQDKTRRANPISAANAKLLSSAAQSVDDEELRSALLRLSRHGMK